MHNHRYCVKHWKNAKYTQLCDSTRRGSGYFQEFWAVQMLRRSVTGENDS